jgi:hypothetical protein
LKINTTTRVSTPCLLLPAARIAPVGTVSATPGTSGGAITLNAPVIANSVEVDARHVAGRQLDHEQLTVLAVTAIAAESLLFDGLLGKYANTLLSAQAFGFDLDFESPSKIEHKGEPRCLSQTHTHALPS